MPTQSQINAFALQDILLSLADSLNHAQLQFRNMPPYDEFGRPNTIYHLPYLDFQLKVMTEFEENMVPPSGNSRAAPSSKAVLKFRPNVVQGSQNVQIESTISGRFIAVVPNEGLPHILLDVTNTPPVIESSSSPNLKFEIEAHLTQNTQNLSNAKVEFNFDALGSKNMNGNLNISTPPIFSINEGVTDTQGKMKTTVKLLASHYEQGLVFLFVINSGTISASISVSKNP